MKNENTEKKKIRARFMNMAVIISVGIFAVFAFVGISNAWFASNEIASATGMSVNVATDLAANINIYRLDESAAPKTLDFVDSQTIEFELEPGSRETFVLTLKRSDISNSPLNISLIASEFNICHYGYQSFDDTSLLADFLQCYIDGTTFAYTDNASTVTVEQPTVDQYMAFTYPVTNVINVTSKALDPEDTAFYGTAATDDEKLDIIENKLATDYSNIFTDINSNPLVPFPLFQSTYVTNDDEAVALSTDAFTSLGDGETVLNSFEAENADMYAVVIRFEFPYNAVSPSASVNVGGTDRTVFIDNCNPQMYQKIRFALNFSSDNTDTP